MQHGENNDSPPPTDLSEFLKILYLRSGSVRVSGDPDSPARRWATNKCVRNYIVSIYLAIEFMNSEYLTLRSLRIGPTMSQDWSDSEYPGKKWLSRWINQSFTRWQNKLSVRLAWLNDWMIDCCGSGSVGQWERSWPVRWRWSKRVCRPQKWYPAVEMHRCRPSVTHPFTTRQK